MAATASAGAEEARPRELAPLIRHSFSKALDWLAARAARTSALFSHTPPQTSDAALPGTEPVRSEAHSSAAEKAAPAPEFPSPARTAVERQSRTLVELAEAVTRARRAGHAEMKTRHWADLMSRVSHDLRTPLNAVIGFSDVMHAELLGPVGNPRYREYARHISDSGRELLKSAEDTLTFTALLANPDAYRRKSPLALDDLTHDAWSFFCDVARARDIRFELIARADLEVMGERRPLRQALVNLFAEALRRAEDGGLIALVAHVECDIVELEIHVDRARPDADEDHDSLPVCLARALLELQGATLVAFTDRAASWRAATVLSCAAQRDFFDLVPARPEVAAHAC